MKKIREILDEAWWLYTFSCSCCQSIKHSISPFIHNRAFEATAINGAYVAWEIEAGDLAETVANIRRYQMFGINLSMPYKEQVIPYLDELSDEARLIGAVIRLLIIMAL